MSPTSATRAPGTVAALRSRVGGELVFALGVLGLGVFVLIATGDIYEPPSGTSVGPRVFPYVVGALLLLVGTALTGLVLAGRSGEPEESEDLDADASTSWVTVVALVVALVVHVNLIEPAGWPVAAAVLFAACAFVLGARRVLLTLAISVALSVVLQVLFAHLLGLSLPPGPLLEEVTWFRG